MKKAVIIITIGIIAFAVGIGIRFIILTKREKEPPKLSDQLIGKRDLTEAEKDEIAETFIRSRSTSTSSLTEGQREKLLEQIGEGDEGATLSEQEKEKILETLFRPPKGP